MRCAIVMPGLVPGIHVFRAAPRDRWRMPVVVPAAVQVKAWMAGTSPAMTTRERMTRLITTYRTAR
jgi:hypothetical protein